MHTDHLYKIGNSHQVCQDYAISGMIEGKEIAYAIVSDGCSSVPNFDVGTRILALAAKKVIEDYYHKNEILNFDKEKDFLKKTILKNAFNVVKILNLPKNILTATLHIIIHSENWTKFIICGDGIIVLKDEDFLYINSIEYQSGVPHYLIYQYDKELKEIYKKTFNQEAILKSYTLIKPDVFNFYQDGNSNFPYNFNFSFSKLTKLSPIEFAIIFSDGMQSFGLNLKKLVPLIEFKTFNGCFLQRRFN